LPANDFLTARPQQFYQAGIHIMEMSNLEVPRGNAAFLSYRKTFAFLREFFQGKSKKFCGGAWTRRKTSFIECLTLFVNGLPRGGVQSKQRWIQGHWVLRK
jgi:hypothetical protein